MCARTASQAGSMADEEPTLPVYRDRDCDVGELLGAGAFAQVFDGELLLGSGKPRAVAFKVVKPESMMNFKGCDVCYEDVMDAFRTECSLLVALGSHPNVVPVLGVIDTGKVLVMEKAETELSSAIKATNGALPLRRMRRWMQDILRGVDFIHRHGVIHKDMKSSNILISRSGTLQICDFGLLHGQGRRVRRGLHPPRDVRGRTGLPWRPPPRVWLLSAVPHQLQLRPAQQGLPGCGLARRGGLARHDVREAF